MAFRLPLRIGYGHWICERYKLIQRAVEITAGDSQLVWGYGGRILVDNLRSKMGEYLMIGFWTLPFKFCLDAVNINIFTVYEKKKKKKTKSYHGNGLQQVNLVETLAGFSWVDTKRF